MLQKKQFQRSNLKRSRHAGMTLIYTLDKTYSQPVSPVKGFIFILFNTIILQLALTLGRV